MSIKKRLALGAGAVASVGAAATLIAGVTFGLFSATETGATNSFTAGTVTVGLDSPASVTCTITNMVPGDSSTTAPIGNAADPTCTYNVKYTGSAKAWLGVDVAVANGGTTLYDGSNTGLQLFLKDAANTYLTSTATNTAVPSGSGTTYKAQTTGTATSLPAAGISNLLVDSTAGGSSTGTVSHLNVDYALPLGSGNGYQAGSVTVTLTFHAVQAGNNPVPGTCSSSWQCGAGGGFLWS
jgi:predicted ribosomally synthesized peptide with SipW-like signal peptide